MTSEPANLPIDRVRSLGAGGWMAVFGLVAILAAATAAWFAYGPQIFMTFASSALAWCF